MEKWRIGFYIIVFLNFLSWAFLAASWEQFETVHSSSRGFALLLPIILSPVFVGLAISAIVLIALNWKRSTWFDRPFGLVSLPVIYFLVKVFEQA